ncbi:hypothetical protein D3C75_684960 [compost metagenome]
MLKPFTAFSKSIPLDDSWEVIVVGGGPAGCAAAAAAAREGARTLLIEGTGALGGWEPPDLFRPGAPSRIRRSLSTAGWESVVPAGVYKVATLELKSNVDLYLEGVPS